jgi:hypothetical protein
VSNTAFTSNEANDTAGRGSDGGPSMRRGAARRASPHASSRTTACPPPAASPLAARSTPRTK